MSERTSSEVLSILNPRQSLLAGGLAGMVQSIVSLPFWTMKVRKQCRLPWTLELGVLYKGFFPATFAITSMSIAEVCFTTIIHRWIHNTDGADENSFERINAALIGGTAATIVSNPIGVVITQQHKMNSAHFMKTLYALVAKQGYRSLYVSLVCNWAINAAFTLSFYALYPIMHQRIIRHEYQEIFATLTASLALGLVMSALLQPLDTLKTAQEYHIDEQFRSLRSQFSELSRSKNMRASFYRGFFPATISTVSAITAANFVLHQTERYYLPHQGMSS